MGGFYKRVPTAWMAVTAVCVLQAGVALNGLIEMLSVGARDAAFVTWAACLPALIAVQALHSPPAAKKFRRFSLWMPALQTVLTYVPCLAVRTLWPGMGGFVAGAALAALRGGRGTGVFVAILAVDAAVSRQNGLSYVESAVAAGVTLGVGLAVATLLRIACRLSWMRRAEDHAIRSALQDERQRIGRDMHDLLASRLAFASIRGELANRHLGSQNERARSEVRNMVGLTREVLADMRSMAHDFGDLSFRGEIRNARSLLEGIGVKVTVREDVAIPSGEIGNLFATAVREFVANILRHSEATTCTIALGRSGDAILLSVLNDGVRGARRPTAPAPGHGLANLTSRAAELGGHCRAGSPVAGRFLVTVSCPAKAQAGSPAAATPLPARCAPRRDGFAHRAS
ncbi:sensor histidine kinase [Streptomyces sp. NPDC059785]|uniref:sensor histidine kinase n=1 Tax=unclassified Streptomyces TaxID=2593676 RepID=UPI003664EE99